MGRELLFFIAVANYLLGSVPFSYLIAKKYRKSLDMLGLYNIRAIKTWKDAQSYLLLGVILAGDVAKGFLAMLMTSRIASKIYFLPDTTFWALVLASTFVVVGHNWPIFYDFKGKNGLSSLLGAVLFLNPWAAFAGLWVVLILIPVFDYGMGTMGFKKRGSRPGSIRGWIKLWSFVLVTQSLGKVLAIGIAVYVIYLLDSQIFLDCQIFWIVLIAAIIVLLKYTNRTKIYLAGVIADYKASNVPV